MKKLIKSSLLFLLFAMGYQGVAQTTEREVISSSGDFFSNGSGQISVTIGEPITETFVGSNNSLTQGYQQSKITVSGLNEVDMDYEMSVFPNPTTESITLQIDEIKEGLSFHIMGIEGKFVTEQIITSTSTKIDASQLSRGIYVLKVLEKGRLIKSFKIMKQ